MKREMVKDALRVVFLTLCLMAAVWGYVVYERTCVSWWLPVAAAAGAAMGSLALPGFWRRCPAGSDGRILRAVCQLYAVGTLVYGGLLDLNSRLAPASATVEQQVTVLEKVRVERKRYQRIGRHRYRANGVRVNYYLEVAFDNGFEKRIPVSPDGYNRARENAPLTLQLRAGFLGYPVIVK